MRQSRRGTFAGFTLVDCMFGVLVVALFFSALYAVCSQCIGMLAAGRDLDSAQQYSQYRIEQLRNCTWAQLTSSLYLRNSILNAPQPGSPLIGRVSETLIVNSYPTPATPEIQVTRTAAGTATTQSTSTAVAAADLARVDLVLSWNGRQGARTRSVSTRVLLGRF